MFQQLIRPRVSVVVAPVVAADNASVSAAETATAHNTGTWSDYDDTVTLSASYGTVVKNAGGTWSWSASGDEADSQTVTITATNADHTVSTTTFTPFRTTTALDFAYDELRAGRIAPALDDLFDDLLTLRN